MSTGPLIQPVLRDADLLKDIASAQPARGAVALWWLGQSGFVIKSRFGVLVVDPYLSDSLTRKYADSDRPHIRMTEIPIRPESFTGIDLVLCSHKHSDHMDPETLVPLLGANPGAGIGVPESLLDHAGKIGLGGDRLFGLDAGSTFEWTGFRIEAIPSAHEAIDRDSVGRCLYLGFLVEVDGIRLYHSGDSVVYEGLAELLKCAPLDIMLAPINGRDPARGVPGNMTAREAVELAAVVKPRYLVPHHFDMFTFNTVPVSDFEAESHRLPPGVGPRVLRCGERLEVGP